MVARNLRVTGEESPYFKISCQRLIGSKVAPGMEAMYIMTFTPDENKVGLILSDFLSLISDSYCYGIGMNSKLSLTP